MFRRVLRVVILGWEFVDLEIWHCKRTKLGAGIATLENVDRRNEIMIMNALKLFKRNGLTP
jgi:hypothetical protein